LKEAGLEDRMSTKFDYQAYDFGPYSSVVVKEIEALKTVNLIDIRTVPLTSVKEIVDRHAVDLELDRTPSETKEVEIYRINERGLRIWRELVRQRVPPEIQDRLVDLKRRFNQMDLDDLLNYMYQAYPKYAEKSKIMKELFGLGSRPELTPFERFE
jgi:hypothetical protein